MSLTSAVAAARWLDGSTSDVHTKPPAELHEEIIEEEAAVVEGHRGERARARSPHATVSVMQISS